MERLGDCTNSGQQSVQPLDGCSGLPDRLPACFRWVADFWLDALFALAFFVGQFTMPEGITSPDTDCSWSRGIQECFTSHAQAGSDYIFTYGPLGAFTSAIYDVRMYWYRYGWEWAYSLFVTGAVIALARRLGQKDIRFLFYTSMLLYVMPPPSDLRFEFPALALAVLLLVGQPRVPLLLLSGFFLALLCLVKFSFAVFALPAIAIVTAWKWWETRRAAVLLLPAAYGASVIGLWLATGQALGNLPKFVVLSMEIARGYVEAMANEGMTHTGVRPHLLFRALAIIILHVLVCLAIALRSQHKRRFIACLILILAALHFQFRHAFVRHDDIHCLPFFSFAMALPFVVVVVEPAALSWWMARLGFGLTWMLALQTFSLINDSQTSDLRRRTAELWKSLCHRASVLRHPLSHQAELEGMYRRQCETWLLPRIKALVGDQTIDMVSCNQGVLFLNELHWTPRPVFQSYSAYTPKLLAVNQDFYRGPRAPEFVLFRINPIDGRLPSTEDSGVLMEMLQSYRPVMKEKDYLLFQHQKAAHPQETVPPERTTELTIRLGEVVPISSSPREHLTAAFRFDLKTSGRLLHALYRNPILYVNFRLSDGSFRKYRLVPGLAAHEFLLNPLVEDNDDFVEIYGGKANKRIVALSITQEDFFGWYPYRSDVHLTLKAFLLPFATQLSPSELAPLTRIATLPKG